MSDSYDVSELVETILRLRTAERGAEPGARSTMADTRDLLERMVGPTIRPATAARAIGVSQTALNHWLDKGEIASVLTPSGRREIPLPELLDLIEHIRAVDATTTQRPLTKVIRDRNRAAADLVDVDRLLPRRGGRSHRAPELHALAYHRLIADRLDEQLVEQARRRLASWRASGRIAPQWADEWEQLLQQPLPAIARAISADTLRARELRQTSPFAGALNEQERRRLVEAVEQRVSG
jgi:hypothetical protein